MCWIMTPRVKSYRPVAHRRRDAPCGTRTEDRPPTLVEEQTVLQKVTEVSRHMVKPFPPASDNFIAISPAPP